MFYNPLIDIIASWFGKSWAYRIWVVFAGIGFALGIYSMAEFGIIEGGLILLGVFIIYWGFAPFVAHQEKKKEEQDKS